jgi:hypothetical protein
MHALLIIVGLGCSPEYADAPAGDSADEGGDDDGSAEDAGADDSGADDSDADDSGAEDSGAEDSGTDIDTWDHYAAGWFDTFCVQCHTDAPRDHTDYDSVFAEADQIACGVSRVAREGCGDWPEPGAFPTAASPGPYPTDAERDRLVAWIDDGMAP